MRRVEKLPPGLQDLIIRLRKWLVTSEERRKDTESKDKIRQEWQQCALVVDR